MIKLVCSESDAKILYSKRVFVSLLFLADSYNKLSCLGPTNLVKKHKTENEACNGDTEVEKVNAANEQHLYQIALISTEGMQEDDHDINVSVKFIQTANT